MLEDGTISHEQARRLRSSIDIKTTNPPADAPAARWPWLTAGLIVLMLCGGLVVMQINAVIDAREAVKNLKADLDSQHQHRYDLTPQESLQLAEKVSSLIELKAPAVRYTCGPLIQSLAAKIKYWLPSTVFEKMIANEFKQR